MKTAPARTSISSNPPPSSSANAKPLPPKSIWPRQPPSSAVAAASMKRNPWTFPRSKCFAWAEPYFSPYARTIRMRSLPLVSLLSFFAFAAPASSPKTLRSAAEFLFAVLDVPYEKDLQQCYADTLSSLPADDPLQPQRLIRHRTEISAQPVVERACARIALRHKLVSHLRQSKSAHAVWLLSVYESTHPSIAHGNPPLDLYTAHAWYSLKRFLHPQDPALRSKHDFIRDTAERYPQMPPAAQQAIQLAPLKLSELESRRLKLATPDGLRFLKSLRADSALAN